MKTSEVRNVGIDLIRGISILFVVLLHLNIHLNLKESLFNEILSPRIFKAVFWSGYYGVVMFFTLSGYLITSTVLKRWNNPGDISFKQYYWLRFSRIVPMLIALVVILSILHLLNFEPFRINTEKVSLLSSILSVLTFHVNWLEIQVGYLPGTWDVLWTISIEETFYLVLPFVLVFVRNKWLLLLLFAFILILGPYSRTHFFLDNELGDRNNFNYIDCIALGVFIALATFRNNYSKIAKNIAAFIGTAFVIALIFFRVEVYKMNITSLGLDLTILSLGMALLIFWMHYNANEKGKVFLPLRWLTNMGKYSYEIYLTHMFVVVLLSYIFKKYQLANDSKTYLVLVGVVLSWILGKLVFEYFSNPINKKLRQKQFEK